MPMSVRGIRRTTDPTVEPVTWAEFHDTHFRQIPAHEQAYLEMLITSAREEAEEYMRRALLAQSWTLTLDTWPSGEADWWDQIHTPTRRRSDLYLELPYPPLRSITSINTYAEDDTASPVVVATVFYTDTNSEPGRLVLRSDQVWPIDTRRGSRIEIIYIAGYGTVDTDVPTAIRRGILQHSLWMYEHRGDEDKKGNGIYLSGAASSYDRYKNILM